MLQCIPKATVSAFPNGFVINALLLGTLGPCKKQINKIELGCYEFIPKEHWHLEEGHHWIQCTPRKA
jgi:hypothetical protein